MRFRLNKILSVSMLLLVCGICYAEDPPPPEPPPPPGLPVDGGVFILLFISVSYGLYKLYQFNINKKNPV